MRAQRDTMLPTCVLLQPTKPGNSQVEGELLQLQSLCDFSSRVYCMSLVAIVLCPPVFLTIDGILSKHVVLVNRYPVSWVPSHILNLPFQISNPHMTEVVVDIIVIQVLVSVAWL